MIYLKVERLCDSEHYLPPLMLGVNGRQRPGTAPTNLFAVAIRVAWNSALDRIAEALPSFACGDPRIRPVQI